MDKNGGKNGEFPNGDTQFTSEKQPSPEAKKKGWERRREAQKIMDEIMELADMSYADIKALLKDIKDNPDKHTLREVKLANYLMEKKYTIDYLDRHISKAPQDIDVTSGGEKIEGVVVRFVKGKNGTENTDNSGNGSNSPSGEDNRGGEAV